MPLTVEFITEDFDRVREPLITLLQDAVDGGASLGFWAPLSTATADAYWSSVFDDVTQGTCWLFCAFEDGRLLGTVQIALATKQNAPHRAEVQKLMVLSSERSKGIGRVLMQRLEAAAYDAGRMLLILDTETGSPAEPFYAKLGYTALDSIPRYVVDGDGRYSGTTIFYKHLSQPIENEGTGGQLVSSID